MPYLSSIRPTPALPYALLYAHAPYAGENLAYALLYDHTPVTGTNLRYVLSGVLPASLMDTSQDHLYPDEVLTQRRFRVPAQISGPNQMQETILSAFCTRKL
eukprot:1378888-Rhodomonas_salina.1